MVELEQPIFYQISVFTCQWDDIRNSSQSYEIQVILWFKLREILSQAANKFVGNSNSC